ncbi:MAG: hypothetical protein ACTSPB_00460 [Candidatus Thorarchaeota archaeon]
MLNNGHMEVGLRGCEIREKAVNDWNTFFNFMDSIKDLDEIEYVMGVGQITDSPALFIRVTKESDDRHSKKEVFTFFMDFDECLEWERFFAVMEQFNREYIKIEEGA